MKRFVILFSLLFLFFATSSAKSQNVLLTKNKKNSTGQTSNGDKAPVRPIIIGMDYNESKHELCFSSTFDTATAYLMDSNGCILDCASASNAILTVPDGYEDVIILIDSENWYAIGHIEL